MKRYFREPGAPKVFAAPSVATTSTAITQFRPLRLAR